MPPPMPTLSYATPPRQPPAYLAVILNAWAVATLFVALYFIVMMAIDFFAGFPHDANELIQIGVAAALVGWSIYTIMLARRIRRANPLALRRASLIAIAIECVLWVLNIAFIVYISTHSVEDTSPIGCSIFTFPLPIAATITRILLRRAARHFGTPLTQ